MFSNWLFGTPGPSSPMLIWKRPPSSAPLLYVTRHLLAKNAGHCARRFRWRGAAVRDWPRSRAFRSAQRQCRPALPPLQNVHLRRYPARRRPHDNDAITASETEFFILSQEPFNKLAEEHKKLAFTLLTAISRSLALRHADTEIAMLHEQRAKRPAG